MATVSSLSIGGRGSMGFRVHGARGRWTGQLLRASEPGSDFAPRGSRENDLSPVLLWTIAPSCPADSSGRSGPRVAGLVLRLSRLIPDARDIELDGVDPWQQCVWLCIRIFFLQPASGCA